MQMKSDCKKLSARQLNADCGNFGGGMRLFLFLIMAIDHLVCGEWQWFSRLGIAAMWAGAGQAARANRG